MTVVKELMMADPWVAKEASWVGLRVAKALQKVDLLVVEMVSEKVDR